MNSTKFLLILKYQFCSYELINCGTMLSWPFVKSPEYLKGRRWFADQHQKVQIKGAKFTFYLALTNKKCTVIAILAFERFLKKDVPTVWIVSSWLQNWFFEMTLHNYDLGICFNTFTKYGYSLTYFYKILLWYVKSTFDISRNTKRLFLSFCQLSRNIISFPHSSAPRISNFKYLFGN